MFNIDYMYIMNNLNYKEDNYMDTIKINYNTLYFFTLFLQFNTTTKNFRTITSFFKKDIVKDKNAMNFVKIDK